MKRAVLWLLALLLALPGAAAAQKDEADEARRIVTLLLRGDTDAVYARFAGAMRQAMSAEQLALVPAQLQAMAGEFVGFGRSQGPRDDRGAGGGDERDEPACAGLLYSGRAGAGPGVCSPAEAQARAAGRQ